MKILAQLLNGEACPIGPRRCIIHPRKILARRNYEDAIRLLLRAAPDKWLCTYGTTANPSIREPAVRRGLGDCVRQLATVSL
jgi:hypothetical protein